MKALISVATISLTFSVPAVAQTQICHVGKFGGETCFSTLGSCQSQVQTFGGACVYKSAPTTQPRQNAYDPAQAANSVMESYYRGVERRQERERFELEQQLLKERILSERENRAQAAPPAVSENNAEAESLQCSDAVKFLMDQGLFDEATSLLKKCEAKS